MAATDREQQILAWIKQNPLISQNELAQLCGITRSGVAAHISNLMKKGYIQGKGYIVTPPSYVAVVGAINIDHYLSLIHISEPTRLVAASRMPSSA